MQDVENTIDFHITIRYTVDIFPSNPSMVTNTISSAKWEMSHVANNYDEWNLYDDTDECHGIFLGSIKGKKNATLAKAAPKLLQACKRMIAEHYGEPMEYWDGMQGLEDAVAEAEQA